MHAIMFVVENPPSCLYTCGKPPQARSMAESQPITDPRLRKVLARAEQHVAAKVYQFPLWPDPKRGVPNDFARSALFTARKGIGKEYLEDVEIFCQGGIRMTYTGARLTQDHLDIFEGVMHLARQSPENTTIRFSAHGFLKLIGRTTSGSDHKRLLRAFKHLTATAVCVQNDKGQSYFGSLLPAGKSDEDTERFEVTINRDLIRYFEQGYTLIELKQRKALARSPLARHLLGWLSSHDRPYPVTVQYLYELSGSDAKELKEFRRSLRNALKRLVEVGVLADWHIDEADKVHMSKALPTPA